MLHAIMRKAAMLLAAIFGFTALSLAQTVTGTVKDKKGDPLPGITVTVKGTKNATSTNNQGVYTLNNVGADGVLRFTGAGISAQEVAVAGKSSVNAELETSVSNLNEVVVVGYGTRKVKDATGSVASLSTKDFNKGQISTPEQLLQGRTPGVIVTPSSGEPGAAATINIRGTSSIRGSQEPLYVVDGVPISSGGTSGSLSGIEGSSTPKNPLMFLNPNDIENISVLKDASSTAIYGSRGANGVILITTKSGRGSKGSFSFSASTSVAKIAKRYDLLDAPTFLSKLTKIKQDQGLSAADIATSFITINKGANTNWQDEIFRTGVSQNYNLGWGIGAKNTSVRVSGSYDKQIGIIKSSSLQRMTGRLNLTHKFMGDRIRIDLNSTYSNVKNEYPPLTNNAGYQGSLMGAAISFNPTYPVFNADGTFYDPGDGNRNPSLMLAYFKDNDNVNRFLNNISGSVELTKGLTYKATFGYDQSKGERLSFADPRLGSAYGGTNNIFGKNLDNPITNNGRGVRQNVDLKSILVEHTLSLDKVIDGKHSIKGLLGYAYQTSETQYNGKIGWGLTKINVTEPFTGSGTDIRNNKFTQYDKYYNDVPSYSKSDLQSYFARAEYSYEDKYYLTGTVRIDGSSKFGKDNKYGTFPAFAAKWRIVKESFAGSLAKVFSDLSIRANYGIIGSQDGLGPYDAIDQQRNYYDNSGNISNQLIHQGNKQLKWEQATTSGVGLDFALANNRLTGTIDYYSTKRKNILFYGPVPGGFSATSYYFSNLPGYVLNTGVEVSLNYNVIKTQKFSWSVNYNMTFLKNKVKDMKVIVNTGAVSGQGLSGAYAQTIKDGYPLFTWKMPVYKGLDKDGFAIYAGGDELLGSALPTFLAGLTNNFTYGRLSASIFVNASTGFYVYNNTGNALLLKGSLNTAHNVDAATANSNESTINPGSVSSRWLEKGDFLRISNATLSYSFDVKSKAVKSLSAFVSGQNIALFTGYSGLDPEVNIDKQLGGYPSRGFDYTGYPKSRTFTLGINLGF